MDYSQVIENDAHWNDPDAFSGVRRKIFQEGKRQRLLVGPSWVDQARHKTIPVQMIQCGTQKDFVEGSLASQGMLVLVDRDRNLLQISPADWNPMVSQAPVLPPPPANPDDKDLGLQSTQTDLVGRFFPDLPHVTGRFRLVGVLSIATTLAMDFQVGASQAKFPEELASVLASIPPRKSIPAEIMGEPRPWKALAVSEEIAKGIRAQILPQADHLVMKLEFALPQLPGERLQLEPGAVMSNGMRPPDGVKWVHLVLAGTKNCDRHSLLLPVSMGFSDQLARGRFEVDLSQLAPSIAAQTMSSLYLFSGSEWAGPLQIPLPKPRI